MSVNTYTEFPIEVLVVVIVICLALAFLDAVVYN